MTMTLNTILATRENLDSIVQAVKPLCGGVWLATDRATQCHWIVEASTVVAARSSRYGKGATGAGLVTVSARGGSPTFVIESHDSLTWLMPGETLVVQEGRYRGSAIMLQRIDDIDAPTVSGETLDRRLAAGEIVPAIEARDGRFFEVAECLLPTGDIGIDAELRDVETAVKECVRLTGPTHGSAELLKELESSLNAVAARPELTCHVWITALRGTISRLSRTMPAN